MMDHLVSGAMQDDRDKSQDPHGNETSYPDSPEGGNMLSSGGDVMAGIDKAYDEDPEGMDDVGPDDEDGAMD